MIMYKYSDSKFLYNMKVSNISIPVDVSNLYRVWVDITKINSISNLDNLVIYYDTFYNYFKSEQDYILWRLKYNL